MLAATETIESVAKVLGEYGAGRGLKVVLDPVGSICYTGVNVGTDDGRSWSRLLATNSYQATR